MSGLEVATGSSTLTVYRGLSKSVQVLLNGIGAILVLALRYHIPSSIYYIPYTDTINIL